MEEDRYTRITLRIPKELHAWLDEAADRTSKSTNAEIVARLQASFDSAGDGDSAELQRKLSHLEGQVAGARAAFEFLAADTTKRITEVSSLLQSAVTLADYIAGAAEEMLAVALELFDGDVLDRKKVEWALDGFQASVDLYTKELQDLKRAQDDFLERPLEAELKDAKRGSSPKRVVKKPAAK